MWPGCPLRTSPTLSFAVGTRGRLGVPLAGLTWGALGLRENQRQGPSEHVPAQQSGGVVSTHGRRGAPRRCPGDGRRGKGKGKT